MNPNQIFRLARMLFGPLINRGINAGIESAARRGKDPAEMSEEERASARKARETANKARKVAKLARRLR